MHPKKMQGEKPRSRKAFGVFSYQWWSGLFCEEKKLQIYCGKEVFSGTALTFATKLLIVCVMTGQWKNMIRYCDNHQIIDILDLNLVYLFEGQGKKLAKSNNLDK